MTPLVAVLLGVITVLVGGGGAWMLGWGNLIRAAWQQHMANRAATVQAQAEAAQAEIDQDKEYRNRQETLVKQALTIAERTEGELKEQRAQNVKLEERLRHETETLRERIKVLEHDRDTLQARVDDLEAENAHLKGKLYDLQHPLPRPIIPHKKEANDGTQA